MFQSVLSVRQFMFYFLSQIDFVIKVPLSNEIHCDFFIHQILCINVCICHHQEHGHANYDQLVPILI